jgi:hypothetical protein
MASRQERQPTHLPSGAIFGREELVEGRSALLELKLGGGVVVARIGGQEGDFSGVRDVRDATPVSANMRVLKATHTHTHGIGGGSAHG